MEYRGLLGIGFFVLLAWICSSDRQNVRFRQVAGGLIAQFVFALIIFKTPVVKHFFYSLTMLVKVLQDAMQAGTEFVFGYLGGGPTPFEVKPGHSAFVLALQALPLLIFMSSLTALLYYWRILPFLITTVGFFFKKTLGVGGALGIGSAAKIIFGMDSAPMCIRPYLKDFTRSELFAFMSVGMATVAGTVMVVYATVLGGVIPDVIGHILSASVINVPAAIMFARILIPDNGQMTEGTLKIAMPAKNAMDAITRGAQDGIQVYVNVIAMLMVLVGLIHLANHILTFLPTFHGQAITLQGMLGYILSPIMWLIGIPYEQAHTAGILMGTKTILNELIAYIDLSKLPAGSLSAKSQLIMVYALCGFANFGSVGIMIGALGTLVPERRHDVVSLGLKTIFSGTLATLSTGAIVSLMI